MRQSTKVTEKHEEYRWWSPGAGGGALPYVGGYQVPVNRPPFLRRSYTQWPPFFIRSTPNDPLFFHFCINFCIKIANFCALRAQFEKFNDFCGVLTENLQILPWNCIFAHWMTPIFKSPHQKKPPIFLVPTPNDPLFSTKSYTECLLFPFSSRHLYVTFIFECPPPPGMIHDHWKIFKIVKHVVCY